MFSSSSVRGTELRTWGGLERFDETSPHVLLRNVHHWVPSPVLLTGGERCPGCFPGGGLPHRMLSDGPGAMSGTVDG